MLFTTLGNVIYRPIHELTDLRWKDIGEHLSQTISNFATEEEILYADIVTSFDQGLYLAVTQNGFTKRFERQELTPWRTYKSKSTKYVKLKDAKDRVVTLTPIVMEDLY